MKFPAYIFMVKYVFTIKHKFSKFYLRPLRFVHIKRQI